MFIRLVIKCKYIVAQFINIQEMGANIKKKKHNKTKKTATGFVSILVLQGPQAPGMFRGLYLVDVVQFGTRAATVVRFLSQPLGADLDSTAARLAAARPVGPFAEFAV